MTSTPKSNGVSWRIPKDLRQRINTKAEWRGQTAEEFVIECMEENTKELKAAQRKIVREHT